MSHIPVEPSAKEIAASYGIRDGEFTALFDAIEKYGKEYGAVRGGAIALTCIDYLLQFVVATTGVSALQAVGTIPAVKAEAFKIAADVLKGARNV